MSQVWYRKATVQTAIITGAFAVVIALIVQFGPRSQLTEQNEQLKFEVQRLETQIAPFRAIAIERYPGNQDEALSRLAEDFAELRRRFEATEGEIRTFEAIVRARVSAVWSTSKPKPDTQALLPGPNQYVELTSAQSDGTTAILLFPSESHTTNAPTGEIGIEYRVSPKLGSYPIGEQVGVLEAYDAAAVAIPFVTAGTISHGQPRITSLEIEFFVNGTSRFKVSITEEHPFDAPAERGMIRMVNLLLGNALTIPRHGGM